MENNTHKPWTLSKAQHDLYWPYVNNLWSRKQKGRVNKQTGIITEYWNCRLHAKKDYKPDLTHKVKRQKTSRQAIGCGMKIKKIIDGELLLFIFRCPGKTSRFYYCD